MKQQLLKLARDIIDLCDKISGNGTSPNTDVIGLIKREFEEQCDSLEKENKVKALNHKRELWAVRAIYDSALFGCDRELFQKVFEFADVCKRLAKDEVIVLYGN